MSEILTKIASAVEGGDPGATLEGVQEALGAGIAAQSILDDGLLKGMGVVGERFVSGEAFIPEVMLSANALNGATEILKEKFKEEGVTAIGKVVIATVKGDLHDIGKNLVKLMLEAVGFEVYDLGADVKEEDIVAKAKEVDADIVALSALLTTTMAEQGNVIKAIEDAGLKGKVKVIVGGAPVTPKFAAEIGADGTSENAASASNLAKRLVGAA